VRRVVCLSEHATQVINEPNRLIVVLREPLAGGLKAPLVDA
jgi:hypothetical protein